MESILKIKLANVYPSLAKEWHPTKNGELTPMEVSPNSHRKIWWICEKGHEWEAVISSRSRGNGCPYCGNKRVTRENCLANLYPELAKEWHPIKNGELTPFNVLSKTSKKVWWKCNKGHEWAARVSNRSALGRGCPYCSKKLMTKENCLGYAQPHLVKEWHPTKNGELTPFDVTEKSSQKVWWKCEKSHEWEAKINNRSNGNECPYCKGRKVCDDNSLYALNPSLAKEWHPTKNGDLQPHHVTFSSNRKVWWQCTHGHEWKALVNSRSRKKGTGCPYCNASSSYPEAYLLFCLNQLFLDVHHRFRYQNTYEVDIYITSLRLAIEYDGVYWHKRKKKMDTEKNKILHEQGIKLIRIREEGLDLIPEYGAYNIQISVSPSNDELFRVFNRILLFIKEIDSEKFCHLDLNKINVEDIETNVREFISLRQLENSLASQFPQLAKEWHPTKNGNLKPENFLPQSNIRIWWICSQGHEWNVSITDRTRKNGKEGTNCPYCYGRYATPENSLAALRPEIAKEWHPTKNGELSAEHVKLKSEKKVWWKCVKGHEWEEPIRQRVVRKGCPYCTGRYITKENCLASLYPDIAEEWHTTLNRNLTPFDVKPGSNKKVWWVCKFGHEWETQICTRTRGRGCPKCASKKTYKNLFKK